MSHTYTNGRVTGLNAGGYAVTYGYDATTGRFQSVTYQPGTPEQQVFTYGYTPNSDLMSMVSASSGLAVTRTYEPQRNLVQQIKNQFGTTVMSQYDYENDDIGRREALTTSGPAFDNMPAHTVEEGTTTYTTNELNQYPQITAPGSVVIGLSYDDDGNLTNDGTLEYVYDAENRMIAATPLNPVSGSKKLEAGYDYQGRRVQKKVFTYTAGTWTLDTTQMVVYDGWNVIQETTTGSSTEDYVWGLDLSGSLQGAGGIGGLLLWKTDRGTFLYLYDANGNVGQLGNSSTGEIAARYEYDPFGNTIVAEGTESQNNPFRFSTKYFDVETGWSYYGKRYYSAKLGRWLTRDPIEEKGGANLYGFVGNDPINRIDRLGLFFKSEIGERVFYSCNCGWIDTVHLEDAQMTLWPVIWDGISLYEESQGEINIIDGLQLNQPCGMTDVTGKLKLTYGWGKKNHEQKIQLALNIGFAFEYFFEEHQSHLPSIGLMSSFAAEDLPSAFLGFMEAAGKVPGGWRTLCKPLGKEESLHIFEAASFYNLPRKNRSCQPQLDDYHSLIAPFLGSCNPCKGKDVTLPAIFRDWVPYLSNGGDYEWISQEEHFNYLTDPFRVGRCFLN